jgi:hypothetical protein
MAPHAAGPPAGGIRVLRHRAADYVRPYFAEASLAYAPGLAHAMPVLFAVILVSADNIQSHLENPFDQIGEDDIIINAEKFVERLQVA